MKSANGLPPKSRPKYPITPHAIKMAFNAKDLPDSIYSTETGELHDIKDMPLSELEACNFLKVSRSKFNQLIGLGFVTEYAHVYGYSQYSICFLQSQLSTLISTIAILTSSPP